MAAIACRFARGSTMIPYAKFFASRRVIRLTSAYASCTLIARVRAPPHARDGRATVGGDRTAQAPPDPLAQHLSGGQELRGALRLESEQRAQLLGRPVERRVAERAPVLGRQVDAPEVEVARHVLE